MAQGITNKPSAHGGAILALAGMNVIWGAMFPLTKPALEVIPPYTFTLLRFAAAMAVLLPLNRRESFTLLRGPDGMKLALIGLLGFCAAQVSQSVALKLSTASDIALLSTTSPIWIAFLAWIWLGERLNRYGGIGFLLAIAGLALIFWPKESVGQLGAGQRVLGDAVFMITGFTWACYNVIGKDLMERHPPLPVITATGIVGTMGVIPFAAYELLSGQTPEFTPVSVAGVAYAALPVTALGFVVLFWALSRVSAAHVAILMYLQPLAGVLIAWLLLHEPLGLEFLKGAGLVLGGAYLVTVHAPVKVETMTDEKSFNM